jgi:hypothetical protein
MWARAGRFRSAAVWNPSRRQGPCIAVVVMGPAARLDLDGMDGRTRPVSSDRIGLRLGRSLDFATALAFRMSAARGGPARMCTQKYAGITSRAARATASGSRRVG